MSHSYQNENVMIYEIDPLLYPKCSGYTRIIAFIADY